jgi:hypothetical protein
MDDLTINELTEQMAVLAVDVPVIQKIHSLAVDPTVESVEMSPEMHAMIVLMSKIKTEPFDLIEVIQLFKETEQGQNLLYTMEKLFHNDYSELLEKEFNSPTDQSPNRIRKYLMCSPSWESVFELVHDCTKLIPYFDLEINGQTAVNALFKMAKSGSHSGKSTNEKHLTLLKCIEANSSIINWNCKINGHSPAVECLLCSIPSNKYLKRIKIREIFEGNEEDYETISENIKNFCETISDLLEKNTIKLDENDIEKIIDVCYNLKHNEFMMVRVLIDNGYDIFPLNWYSIMKLALFPRSNFEYSDAIGVMEDICGSNILTSKTFAKYGHKLTTNAFAEHNIVFGSCMFPYEYALIAMCKPYWQNTDNTLLANVNDETSLIDADDETSLTDTDDETQMQSNYTGLSYLDFMTLWQKVFILKFKKLDDYIYMGTRMPHINYFSQYSKRPYTMLYGQFKNIATDDEKHKLVNETARQMNKILTDEDDFHISLTSNKCALFNSICEFVRQTTDNKFCEMFINALPKKLTQYFVL